MMKYSEEQLQRWTQPLSKTEEKRAENAIQMIRSAINANDVLKNLDIEIFLQGSYANNTNVRTESDVDVCVMLKSTFFASFPEGRTREMYGFIPGTMGFFEYRSLVKDALVRKFGQVSDGNKSLKIDENTYHVKADVVPSFQFRNYKVINSDIPAYFVEGVKFFAKDNSIVINYPKQHRENGIIKNNRTNYFYKKMVRIMKHLRNEMLDEHLIQPDIITSFLVESLVWNVSDDEIQQYDNWNDRLENLIVCLWTEFNQGRPKDWKEVSQQLNLFQNHKWRDLDAKCFLGKAFNFLGYGKHY